MKKSIKILFLFIILMLSENAINAQDGAEQNENYNTTEDIDLIIAKQEKADGTAPKNRQFLVDGRHKNRVSGFLASITEFSEIDNELAIGAGGGAAILFNQSFYFGVYGLGITSSSLEVFEEIDFPDPPPLPATRIRPLFAQGGFWLGGVFFSKSLLHLSASAKLGWGVLEVVNDNYDFEYNELARDLTFVATPQLEAELNVAKWFKINAGVGYRYAPGIENSYYEKGSLDGLTGSINLLFGWFN